MSGISVHTDHKIWQWIVDALGLHGFVAAVQGVLVKTVGIMDFSKY